MLDKFATFISTVTNPLILLIPVPYLLVYRVTGDTADAIRWTITALLFLGGIGIFVLLAVRKGIFSDFDVSKREQRPLLFIITGAIILLFFFLVYIFNGPKVLYIACFGILLGVFVLSVINMKIKASIHVATATIFLLTTGILYHLPIYFYLLIPLIGWSRVRIKRHTVPETVVGCVTGIFLILFLYTVLKFVYHITI